VVVTVDLEPAARWVATYYPVEHVVELGEGRLRVTLRAASADWVPRLALRLGGELRVVTPSTWPNRSNGGRLTPLSPIPKPPRTADPRVLVSRRARRTSCQSERASY
jgi:hypothetical protein